MEPDGKVIIRQRSKSIHERPRSACWSRRTPSAAGAPVLRVRLVVPRVLARC